MASFFMGLIIGSVVLSLVASTSMRARADARTVRALDALPEKTRVVVLGCPPTTFDGTPNPYLLGRVASAAAAYHHQAGRRILCSGIDRGKGRNEAQSLAHLLAKASVPDADIDVEEGSARTLDSIEYVVAHCADQPITLVTQPFHMPRALYLARNLGLDAWGLRAGGPAPGYRIRIRESLARLRAVADVWILRR